MKRIYYTGVSVVTSDDVAECILEFGREAARLDTSDSVAIPVLADDGSTLSAQLLVGPASELAVVDEDPHEGAGAIDPRMSRESVAMIKAKLSELRSTVRAEPLDRVDLRAADPYEP